MKPRHHLYLDDDLTAELEAACTKPGASKSGIVARALRAYLRREGGRSDQEMICARLDRLEGRMKRLERDDAVLIETVNVFLHVYLAMTLHLPTPDEAGLARVSRRYEHLIEQIGRSVARAETAAARHDQPVASETAPSPSSQAPQASTRPVN